MAAKPKTVIMPSARCVADLTFTAVLLRKEIERREKELADIEARLEAYALEQPHELLKDEAREGRRVRLPNGVAVVFTADELIGSFKDKSAKHDALKALAGESLGVFFKAPTDWKRAQDDGQKFRRIAREAFEPEVATAFLKECRAIDKDGIPKSKTVFEYPAAD